MSNKELEKALREQLYDHPSSVDAETTWKAVEARLGKKKRRRGIIWWIPGLLLAILLGGYVWAGLDSYQDTPIQEVVVKQVVAESTALISPEASSVPTEIVAIANSNRGDSRPGGLRSLVDEVGKSAEASESKPFVARHSSVNTSNPNTKIQPTKVDTSFTSPLAELVETTGIAPTTTKEETDVTEQRSRELAAISLLPSTTITPVVERFYDPTTPPFSELKGPTECPVFIRTQKAGWELAARGTYSKILRELISTSEVNTGQLDRNLQVERPLEALTLEVLLGYRSANNFTLRTGIGLTRINSVATFSLDSLQEGRVDGVSEIIINAAGDTTLIFGEVDGFTRTRAYYEYYNRLTTIDLPILLGKTFTRDRWSLGLEAGPVFNLRSRGSARYQLADLSFSERDAAAFAFRPRLIGLGWQGNARLAYRLLPQLEVNLGLRAHRLPRTGVEEEVVGIRTNYTLYGGYLGVGWRF